jgi:hypothetical protein
VYNGDTDPGINSMVCPSLNASSSLSLLMLPCALLLCRCADHSNHLLRILPFDRHSADAGVAAVDHRWQATHGTWISSPRLCCSFAIDLFYIWCHSVPCCVGWLRGLIWRLLLIPDHSRLRAYGEWHLNCSGQTLCSEWPVRVSLLGAGVQRPDGPRVYHALHFGSTVPAVCAAHLSAGQCAPPPPPPPSQLSRARRSPSLTLFVQKSEYTQ